MPYTRDDGSTVARYYVTGRLGGPDTDYMHTIVEEIGPANAAGVAANGFTRLLRPANKKATLDPWRGTSYESDEGIVFVYEVTDDAPLGDVNPNDCPVIKYGRRGGADAMARTARDQRRADTATVRNRTRDVPQDALDEIARLSDAVQRKSELLRMSQEEMARVVGDLRGARARVKELEALYDEMDAYAHRLRDRLRFKSDEARTLQAQLDAETERSEKFKENNERQAKRITALQLAAERYILNERRAARDRVARAGHALSDVTRALRLD